MSKKDYIAIAKILKNSETVQEVKRKIADYFENNNPRFDRERFYKACQPDERKDSSQ